MWATEVQKVDIETLPKFEERELFRTYMEDFNTGTLPHRKYYNLELYERRRVEKAAKRNKPLVWPSKYHRAVYMPPDPHGNFVCDLVSIHVA
jgi:hypothetical protein